MSVFVTGSAGFIGGALVERLAAEGKQVATFDRRRMESAPPGVREHVGELCDAEALAAAVADAEPRTVLHLAARTDLDERCGLEGYAANTDGVANLLAAVSACPSVERVVWTSTQLVCRVGYRPTHDRDYCPHTLYGRSKVTGEELVRAADGGGKIWCLVRPTTVWGPGMSPHYQGLLKAIERGVYFHVGRRPLLKSYSYIENIVQQYVALARAPTEQVQGKTFYLADEPPIDLKVWCDGLARELGARRIPTLPVGAARLLARVGDGIVAAGMKRFPFTTFRLNNILAEYRFDLEPTIAVCGPPVVPFDEAVARTARWFQAKNRV